MNFIFHKEIPKITSYKGSKLESGNFVSVTVSKAGLVQPTFSYVKSSLIYHNRLPMDRGGSVMSIDVIKIVPTLQILQF